MFTSRAVTNTSFLSIDARFPLRGDIRLASVDWRKKNIIHMKLLATWSVCHLE